MTESAHNGYNSLSNTSKTLLFYYGELSSWEIYLTQLHSQCIMSLWLSQERRQCLLRAQGYKQESLPGGCSTSCTSFLLEHCLWHRWDTQAVLTELSEGHTAGLAELSADSLQLGELRDQLLPPEPAVNSPQEQGQVDILYIRGKCFLLLGFFLVVTPHILLYFAKLILKFSTDNVCTEEPCV